MAATTIAAVLLSTSSERCAFICRGGSGIASVRHNQQPTRLMTASRSWHLSQSRGRIRRRLPLSAVSNEDKSERKGPIRVIILQHSNEIGRRSATAPLLFGDKNGHNDDGGDISQYFSPKRWIWSGRKDNETIQEQIEQIKKRDGLEPALLWTGGVDNQLFDQDSDYECKLQSRSFIVLDGTWKEARAMFRKMPFLRLLPRISLEGGRWQTQYNLRSDYSNWRERFSSRSFVADETSGSDTCNGGSDLLCTAESVAALLDLNGLEEGGVIIRRRLKVFQDQYGL